MPPLFAELSDAAIATIAGSAVTIITTIGGIVVLWLKLKYNGDNADSNARLSAQKVVEVKQTLATTQSAQDHKIEALASSVAIVHNDIKDVKMATDGIVTQLVDTTKTEAFQRGGDEARAADAAKLIAKPPSTPPEVYRG